VLHTCENAQQKQVFSERDYTYNRRTTNNIKQGVAIMGRNSTGPPWSVGRPTADMPGGQCTDCSRARSAHLPPASSITDDDRRWRQTPATITGLACLHYV